MFICGANNLELNKQMVNKLNVFPVPDGDTGTNMSLTMSVAVNDIKTNTSDDIGTVAEHIATSLLRGARGNSGVILSLIFRGMAKSLSGAKCADATLMANSFKNGVDAAYKAVMKPTEGTILTVARLASVHVSQVAPSCNSMKELFEALVTSADETLKKTPDMLPVLKQANVVDAGGMGLLIIYKGMLHYIINETMIEVGATTDVGAQADFSSIDTENIKFTYCTEFLIVKNGHKASIERLKKFLDAIGDSIVVVEDDEIIKVHVHTNNPGSVLEKALTMGTLSKIKIENMKEQHTQLQADVTFVAAAVKKYGFVVTCSGEGLVDIFKDLGADNIVEGGQTMNPSTEDILEDIEKTPSEIVFVLPNNKNIIMAAQQAAALSKKQVVVIETKSVPQGISAMLGFDADMDLDKNIKNMTETMNNTKTGSITFADRDSVFFDKEIKKGQFLALNEGSLFGVSENRTQIAIDLIKELCGGGGEIVSIYYGQDVKQEEADELLSELQDELSEDVEVTMLYGGQPVYYYIISCE